MLPVRDYARAIVLGECLADKLVPPPQLELLDAEPPLRLVAPGREPRLSPKPGRAARVPPVTGMKDPNQRMRIIHSLANHELQAIELFAWALLAFPQAPIPFKRGLVTILAEEQRHFGLYAACLARLGASFGDFSVTTHFWNKLEVLSTPLGFLCGMGLTFENANLDFAREYADAARAVGDQQLADALAIVHEDEIGHVRFAWRWVEKFADGRDPTSVYIDVATFPLGPARARGKTFDEAPRRRAGLSESFIRLLAETHPTRPSGAPR